MSKEGDMGGRGSSSASARSSIARAVLGENAASRLKELGSDKSSYRNRLEAESIVRADRMNGTAQVDRMRADVNFSRIGWISQKTAISPGLLRDWADGNELGNYASGDRKKLQDAASKILARYDAGDATAFYRYGHMMRGKSGD